MKKLFFAILTLTLLTSCEDPVVGPGFQDGDPNDPSQEILTVDFDGETYTADQVATTIVGGVINITGFRGNNGEAIILSVFANSSGTYPLGVTTSSGQLNGGTYMQETGSTSPFVSVTNTSSDPQGEITISEMNTVTQKITGTFHFTGYSNTIDSSGSPVIVEKEFTNGKFYNLQYEGDLGNTNGNTNSDNSFFAKVDGTEFVEDSFTGAKLTVGATTTITLSAVKNSLETIGLFFPADIIPGTYNLSSFGEYRGQYSISTTDINGAQSGTVTVTTHNPATRYLEATFNFEAGPIGGTATHSITEGDLVITYDDF